MSKSKLSLLEQETIILYNQGEKDVEIYTHDPALIRKLKEQPQTAKLKSVNRFGGYTYIVPKKELVVRFKRHLTGEALIKSQNSAREMTIKRVNDRNKKNGSA